MSKTKQPTKKAPSKSKAPASSKGKATKAAKKPAGKTTREPAPAEAAVQTGVCPKGDDHEWKSEDGQTFCAKCFEPSSAAPEDGNAESQAITAEQTATDQPATDQPMPEAASKKRKAKVKSEVTANGKRSAIDAAAKVLSEAGQPMNTKQMIAAMADKGYWTSPGGKTPAATLYSAILREITTKGAEARFQKTERGKFALRGA